MRAATATWSTGAEHVALVSPLGHDGPAPLVRLHSECLTGDVFGSQRCDCGPQLERSLARVAAEGGVVVYLRGHEGRGVGLLNKLQAYELQDRGFDTVDAQIELGLPVDAREYAAGAAILADLGIPAVRLLTNNPMKVNAMREFGIDGRRRSSGSASRRCRTTGPTCAPSVTGSATTCVIDTTDQGASA